MSQILHCFEGRINSGRLERDKEDLNVGPLLRAFVLHPNPTTLTFKFCLHDRGLIQEKCPKLRFLFNLKLNNLVIHSFTA